MSFTLASFNAELRFSKEDDHPQSRGNPEKLLTHIKQLNPDVMVVVEFSGNNLASGVDDQLKTMGYDWRDVAYEDGDKEPEWAELETQGRMPYMRILSRLAIVSSETPRFGDIRTMQTVTVLDPATGMPVEIIAMHLHDRKKEFRQAQVKDIVPFVNRDGNKIPKVMGGDFNTVHDDDDSWPVRLLGSKAAAFCARHLPSKFPLDSMAHAHEDIRGFLLRAIDMTKGDVLFSLEEETDLRELDLSYRPTTTPKLRGHELLPSIRLLQLDHFFASERLQAEPVTISRDLGSDHRAIMTTISFK
jgi:endonuclease/exonuclease/phosphatase family metal-dependent hydrolase